MASVSDLNGASVAERRAVLTEPADELAETARGPGQRSPTVRFVLPLSFAALFTPTALASPYRAGQSKCAAPAKLSLVPAAP
jgi:hypothetical protein